MKATDTIRIVLVDDHPLMLFGIRSILEGLAGVEVVGTASCGEDALRLVGEQNPNLLIFDIVMPGMDSVELARRVRETCPDTKLLALSVDTSRATLESLVHLGAEGFLPKSCAETDLEAAVRSIASGYEWFGTDTARLIERISTAKAASETIFTPREMDVVRLSCQGLQYKEIASRLGISYMTVVTIKNNIFRKLGINNTVELVLYAVRKNLISL